MTILAYNYNPTTGMHQGATELDISNVKKVVKYITKDKNRKMFTDIGDNALFDTCDYPLGDLIDRFYDKSLYPVIMPTLRKKQGF